jgi:hypothetical protein
MSISVGGNDVDAYKGINACFYTRSADGYDGEEDLSIYFINAADEGKYHCMIKVGYKDGTTKEIDFPADYVSDDDDDLDKERYEATYMITDMADVVIVMACFTQPFENNTKKHMAEFNERFEDELAHWKV